MKGSIYGLMAGCGIIALSGCGGSGGSAFGPSSVNTGSTVPVVSKIGKRPITLNVPLGVQIVAVAPNGKMLGNDQANTVGYYWSSPGATPIKLLAPGYTRLQVISMNNSGQIVGTGTPTSGGFEYPLYWASPTSMPAIMQMPAGQTDAFAVGINASGQIIGLAGVGTNESALYWANSTSTPTILAGEGGDSSLGPIPTNIADSGLIYGTNSYNPIAPATWSSFTANAQALTTPPGTAVEQAILTFFCLSPESGVAGANFSPDGGVTVTPVVWASPGFNMTVLKAPTGQTPLMYIEGMGKNNVAVGASDNGSSGIAVEWNGFTNAYTDLNSLLPSGTGWSLEAAFFIDDAGDIIGEGKNSSTSFAYFAVNFS